MRDLVDISRLYLRGYGLAQITDWISVNRDYALSGDSIRQDLRKIHRLWLDEMLVNYDEVMARELARIDNLEFAYWQEYERSKQDAVELEEERTRGVSGMTKEERTRKKTSARLADTRYLAGVQWCIEQRCKMLGLYAPQQQNVNMDWRIEAKEAGVPDPDKIVDAIVHKMLTEAGVTEAVTDAQWSDASHGQD